MLTRDQAIKQIKKIAKKKLKLAKKLIQGTENDSEINLYTESIDFIGCKPDQEDIDCYHNIEDVPEYFTNNISAAIDVSCSNNNIEHKILYDIFDGQTETGSGYKSTIKEI